MTERKRLSDILPPDTNRDALKKAWQGTAAAAEFAPLPPGEYLLRVLSGELFASRGGTPGYKLKLEVAEGEHAGRLAWHDLWLTPAALPMTKRDLLKLGIDDADKLERPLPPGITIRARLAVRRDNEGNEGNRVRSFEFAGVEKGDAFEPGADEQVFGDDDQGDDQGAGEGKPQPAAPGAAAGPAAPPAAPPGELFPFGANGTAHPKGDRAFVAGEKGGPR